MGNMIKKYAIKRKHKKGFTLLEGLIAFAVLAIVSTVLVTCIGMSMVVVRKSVEIDKQYQAAVNYMNGQIEQNKDKVHVEIVNASQTSKEIDFEGEKVVVSGWVVVVRDMNQEGKIGKIIDYRVFETEKKEYMITGG